MAPKRLLGKVFNRRELGARIQREIVGEVKLDGARPLFDQILSNVGLDIQETVF
jgi:hypothetical protein